MTISRSFYVRLNVWDFRLWSVSQCFVLSVPEVQKESIHRRARGRVTLDDKIPTPC